MHFNAVQVNHDTVVDNFAETQNGGGGIAIENKRFSEIERGLGSARQCRANWLGQSARVICQKRRTLRPGTVIEPGRSPVGRRVGSALIIAPQIGWVDGDQ